ncbi:hypothetical protein H7F33_05490 [Pedobacter sp. PAMC26386]|nr:hypothetical protein H7F33_05490 [Pedobacter sp. PAMC26386]
MSDIELGIDFIFNTPEAQAEAERIKNNIASIGTTADQAAAKLKSSVSAINSDNTGLIERLKVKLQELKVSQTQATSTTSIEKYNIRIQEFQNEIIRLNRIGKQGFDDMGKAIPNFERPKGQLERMKEAADLYKRAILEATSPEMLAKYNAKLEQTEATLKRMRNAGRSGFDVSGIALPLQIERPTSKLGRLEYAASAYQNMAANSGNIEIVTKYNKKLQDTQVEIGRVKNVGKDGFDALGNKIVGSTGAVGKLWGGLRTVAQILPGIGIAGLLAFAIEPLMKYLGNLDLFSVKLSQAVKDKKELAAVQLKGSQDAQRELTDLKLLYNEYGNTNLSLKYRKEAYAELQKMYPDYFNNIKFELQASSATKRAYDELTNAILATARARAAADKITQNSSRQLENEQQIKDLEVVIEKQKLLAKKNLDIVGSGKASGSAGVGASNSEGFLRDAARAEKRAAEAQKKVNDFKTDSNILAKRNLDLEKEVTKQIERGGKIKGNVGGDQPKDTTKADNAALNHQRVLQQKIEDITKEYSRKSGTKDDAELEAIKAKFIKIAKEVDRFNKDPKNKYKVDGSSLNKIRDDAIEDLTYRQSTAKAGVEFEKQKKMYEDYENFKTTFGKDAADKRFGKEVKSNTDRLKQLQDEYLKLTLKPVFGSVLSGGEKERMTEQEKQIKELQGVEEKRYTDAYKQAETYAQKELSIKRDYLQQYDTILKENHGTISAEQIKNLEFERDSKINAAKDEALAKTEIYKKLAQETILLTREQVKEQLKALEAILAKGGLPPEAIEKINTQINGLKLAFKIGVDQTNLDTLQTKVESLKKKLNSKDDQGNSLISEEEFKRTLLDLGKTQAEVDKLLNSITGKSKSNFAQGISDNFKYLTGTSTEFAFGVSRDLDQVSGGFGELSNALGGVNTEAGYTIDTISRLVKVGADAAGAYASFSSGDIVGGVTKTISAVTGFLSIGKKVKEMNAAARKIQDDYYAAAIKGEMEYQVLLRKRDLDTVARGKNSYRAIVDQLEALKKQSPEIQKAYDKIYSALQGEEFVNGVGYKHGTWLRKAKTWDIMASLAGSDYNKLEQLYTQGKLKDQAKSDFEALKKLKEELEAAGVSTAQLQEDLKQLLTGTSTSGLADSLTQLFENGKFAAADFADSFESIMQKAISNSFKYKYLEDAMQPFYNALGNLMSSGTPTKEQIEALKKQYATIGENAADYWKQLETITGVKPIDSKTNNVVAGIQGMTQQTAEIIAGQFGGQRIATLEGNVTLKFIGQTGADQLAVLKAQHLVQMEVAANTLRTANNTDRLYNIETALVSMDKKMSNSNNALRAGGN